MSAHRTVRAVLPTTVAALATASVLAAPGAAHAADETQGYVGHCLDDRGVTVVADYQQLGPHQEHDGRTTIRCAPGDGGQDFSGTGIEALEAAGVEVTGTRRHGTAFVCRLEGRPAAQEPLPVPDKSGYRERCIDTPPANAYWGYWKAESGSWTYADQGASSSPAVPGGLEGWSFALDADADANPPPDLAAQRPRVDRLAGANRYATAARLAGKYTAGVERVYVATGRDYPDALAAAALAGHQDVPVVLVDSGGVPPETDRALRRLAPESVVVVGGSTSVSGSTLDRLRSYTDGRVTRVAGDGREETAATVAARFGGQPQTVHVATGRGFPDALAASAAAGAQGSPVLLTGTATLPAATRRALSELHPERIVLVGGETTVTPAVQRALRGYADVVQRRSGSGRDATAAAVSRRSFEPGVDVAYVATGRSFPDALAGSALAGRTAGPVLLATGARLDDATVTELERLDPGMVVVLGGSTSVSEQLARALQRYVVRR